MEIQIENVGIVKDARIKINGLTIITGPNNSGKSTIGKALYAIVSAYHNLEVSLSFEIEKFSRQVISDFAMDIAKTVNINSNIKEKGIMKFIEKYYFSIKRSYNLEVLLSSFDDDYNQLIDSVKEKPNLLEPIQKSYEKIRKRLDEVKRNIDFMPKFLKDRITRKVNFLFNNQFKNISCENESAQIKLTLSETEMYKYTYNDKMKTSNEFTGFLDNKIYYISDASHIIDNLDDIVRYITDEESIEKTTNNIWQSKAMLQPNDIVNPDHDLVYSIVKGSSSRIQVIYDIEKVNEILDRINKLLPGKLVKKKGATIYSSSEINVKNLASGSKTIALLKLMVESNTLDSKSVLVFDEPEVHLHPEWINSLAELLIIMRKVYGLKIVLTTHSINLLLAIDYMRRKHQLNSSEMTVYQSEKDDKGYVASFNESELEDIFDSFSSPFLSINDERNELLIDEE